MSAIAVSPSAKQSDLSASALNAAIEQIASVILGKESSIRLAVCCLLAEGHLLIEDLPGMGKTTLAHTNRGDAWPGFPATAVYQ